MPNEFVDNAYKTGAGRYVQEKGALSLLGNEVLLLGTKAFVLGGPRSFPLVQDAVVYSLAAASVPFEVAVYEPSPTRADMQRLADDARSMGCDIIVGVGGGRMMDAAKAVACSAGLPLIEVPTSIATCAAYSPLSVMYTEEGAAEGVWRFTREVDAVVVDMDVMAVQPPRLVAAGILDAMAKKLEIENGGTGLDCDTESGMRFAAYEYACVNYELLKRFGLQAYHDVEAELASEALERVTFANLTLTGIVSSLTRGFHQTAHAHRLYDGLRTHFTAEVKPWLHGELVAIGLLMQLVYNGAPEKTSELRAFMRSMNMPCTLAEVGVMRTDKRFDALYNDIAHSEFASDDPQWQQRIAQAFDEIAD